MPTAAKLKGDSESTAANENDIKTRPGTAGGVTPDQLRQVVEKIERVEAEKAEISETLREIYGEAKAFGFDPKILRKVISIRKMDSNTRQEQEEILEVYLNALGM
jgi:uncharacterized protein (UPF0335 family)